MADTSRIQKNVSYVTGSILIDLLIFFTTSFFLIKYSVIVYFVTFAFVPIIIITVLKFSIPIKAQQRDVMVASASNENNYIDIIQGVSVIKGHNEEKVFTTSVETVFSHLQNKIIFLGKTGNGYNLFMDLIGVTLTICLITVSSILVMEKTLNIGEMMAILSLLACLSQLFPAYHK